MSTAFDTECEALPILVAGTACPVLAGMGQATGKVTSGM